MAKAGRNLKLTPEFIKKIIPSIEAGNYIETVCRAHGIDKSTYYKWLQKGEKAKNGIYFEFFHAVRDAEARAERKLIEEWRDKLKESPASYKDFLERRYSERWGKKDRVEVSGAMDINIQIRKYNEETTTDSQ